MRKNARSTYTGRKSLSAKRGSGALGNRRRPWTHWIVNRGAVRRLAIAAMLSIPAGLCAYVVMIRMPGESFAGPPPILNAEEEARSERLSAHIQKLSVEIGARNVFHARALHAAEAYVSEVLSAMEYRVIPQWFEVRGVRCGNLVVELEGHGRRDEILIVGAHYDSYLESPGANDNASGTATVLELARAFRGRRCDRTLRFLLFVNEEPPFFGREGMGSRAYARRCRELGEDVVAMLSLDSVGYYSEEPSTQDYPSPLLRAVYPDRADFVAVVGNLASRRLVRDCLAELRGRMPLASEGTALPGWVHGVGWSDHASFWQEGYAAIMITDTAHFRYAHYHRASDTADRLDYARLALLVGGLVDVISSLANPT